MSEVLGVEGIVNIPRTDPGIDSDQSEETWSWGSVL